MNNEIIEMALCEVDHVMLRPNRLYRFIVMPNCPACEKLASVYDPDPDKSNSNNP